jgi:hypothetical protein
MGLLSSLLGAFFASTGLAVSTAASIYWTAAPLSLYAELLYMLLFLGLINFAVLALLALYYRDAKILWVHHDAAQRRLWCWGVRRADAVTPHRLAPPDGGLSAPPTLAARFDAYLAGLSQAEALLLLGVNNFFAASVQWYATPPERTPPLVQTILPCASLICAIPLSQIMLNDRKPYTQREPLLAVGLIAASLLVSLAPSVASASGAAASVGAGTTSPTDALAWSAVFLASQLPVAGAMISQQAFLLRSGVHRPGATWKDNQVAVFRMMSYNQGIVAAVLGLMWWIDVLPWFGTTLGGVDDFSNAVAYSFQCSMLGPDGITAAEPQGATSACTSSTPKFALLFLLSYVPYLAGTAVVAQDSGVFSTVVNLAQAACLSAFFLIPGTNPDPSNTPVWSVVTALLLSLAGVAVYKRWEARFSMVEQFGESRGCAPVPDSSQVAQDEKAASSGSRAAAKGEEELTQSLLAIAL